MVSLSASHCDLGPVYGVSLCFGFFLRKSEIIMGPVSEGSGNGNDLEQNPAPSEPSNSFTVFASSPSFCCPQDPGVPCWGGPE